MHLERFSGLDDYSRVALRRLASNWRESPARPAVPGDVALRWHARVLEWVHDPSVPLLIARGSGNRGACVLHEKSGRNLLSVDDAPSEYLMTLALRGRILEIPEMMERLRDGRMPVARRLSAMERPGADYTGTLDSMDGPDLASLGYSIRHVTQVGVRNGGLQERAEVELIAHSLLLLSPINAFVVPLAYAAIAELPEFIAEMDDARTFHVAAS
ncbi:MAG: hypothetical protein FJW30_07685 [Acidobacteria bacterium]|nr:hypothetical protein [Acidobacteriota bacterium]